MTGFKLRTSGVGSYCSTTWATTTAQLNLAKKLSEYFTPILSLNLSFILEKWLDKCALEHQRAQTSFIRRSFTVQLTFSLTSLDKTNQINLLLIFKQTYSIEISRSVDEPDLKFLWSMSEFYASISSWISFKGANPGLS